LGWPSFETSEWITLDSLNERTYADDGSGFIETKTSYTYDDSNVGHMQLSSETTYGSDGNTICKRYLYPADPESGAPVEMVRDKFMHKFPTLQETYINNKLTYKQKTSYTYFADRNMVLPTRITTYPKGGEDTKDEFLNYDMQGNLVLYQPQNDIATSYLWGYNHTLPIAKAMNAAPGDIFYTSFEDNTGVIFEDAQHVNLAKTGTRVLNSGNYTFPSTFQPAMQEGLKMSYWYWDAGQWKYSNVLDFSRSFNRGQKIDEVRVFSENAKMQTLTYNPLVGITSQCDENDRVVKYRYDSAGRLESIKNDDGNILKNFSYKYTSEKDFVLPADEPLPYLSADTLFHLSPGQTRSINVECNGNWIVKTDCPFLSINKSCGYNNDSFSVTAQSGLDHCYRIGKITLSSKYLTVSITVAVGNKLTVYAAPQGEGLSRTMPSTVTGGNGSYNYLWYCIGGEHSPVGEGFWINVPDNTLSSIMDYDALINYVEQNWPYGRWFEPRLFSVWCTVNETGCDAKFTSAPYVQGITQPTAP
jgi:hypothetical protein